MTEAVQGPSILIPVAPIRAGVMLRATGALLLLSSAAKLIDGIPGFLEVSRAGHVGWTATALLELALGLLWVTARPTMARLRTASFAMLVLAGSGIGMSINGITRCPCLSGWSPLSLKVMIAVDLVLALSLALVSTSRRAVIGPGETGLAILKGSAACGIGTLAIVLAVKGGMLGAANGEPGGRSDLEVLDVSEDQALAQVTDGVVSGSDWRRGCYVVLFVRHDCADCRDIIPEWQASELVLRRAGVGLLLVDLSSGGPRMSVPGTTLGKLRDDRRWFIPTPQAMVLRDGVKVVSLKGSAVRPANVVAAYGGTK